LAEVWVLTEHLHRPIVYASEPLTELCLVEV